MPKAIPSHVTDNNHIHKALSSLSKTDVSDMLLLAIQSQVGVDDTVILAKMESLLEKAREAAGKRTRAPMQRLFRKQAATCLSMLDTDLGPMVIRNLQTSAVAYTAVADAIYDHRKDGV